MTNYSIQNLPADERPRERFVQLGPESLSTAELIAIILGNGSKSKPILELANEIVIRFGGLRELSEATLSELLEIKGIGLVKAIQLLAALNLGKRVSKEAIPIKYSVKHPSSVYHLIKDELEFEKRENFVVVLQDIKGYLISYEIVSIGHLSQALVHPREVFYPAIRHKAACIIIAHNHPSGDPSPSVEDLELTKALIEIGFLLGIPLQDHLIIGHHKFISLRQQGILFS